MPSFVLLVACSKESGLDRQSLVGFGNYTVASDYNYLPFSYEDFLTAFVKDKLDSA